MSNINRAKYQQAILYFLRECDNEELGRTKLMKLLYYLDFDHFEKFRTSVTGDVYRALPHGPVPDYAEAILSSMVESGLLAFEFVPKGDWHQHRYRPAAPCDLSVFSKDELVTLEAVADTWRMATTTAIEDATHREAPWRMTEQRGRIPYTLALHRHIPSMPSADEREDMIWSAIGSQSLEGVVLSYEEAARRFDKVMQEPVVKLHL